MRRGPRGESHRRLRDARARDAGRRQGRRGARSLARGQDRAQASRTIASR